MKSLLEEIGDIHIYMDDSTGKYYIFDGKRLVLIGEKPQIGDKGNEDIQKQEEQERKKQIEKEKEEEKENQGEADGSSPGDSTGGDGSSNSDGDEEELKRLERIKNKFNDDSIGDKIKDEAESKVTAEKLRKAAKEISKYNNSPLKKFKESLQGFIKKEIGEVKDKSWGKINKKYAGTGTIKPGTSKHASGKVPVVNVYFDRSGSWDAAKTNVGMQAISTLNNYVRQKKLKVNIFYFNNDILDSDYSDGMGRGGTNPEPVMQHILATKPDNVIVMTDEDFDSYQYYDVPFTPATVPGAVWLLFKGGVSKELQNRLKGKKLTKSFILDS